MTKHFIEHYRGWTKITVSAVAVRGGDKPAQWYASAIGIERFEHVVPTRLSTVVNDTVRGTDRWACSPKRRRSVASVPHRCKRAVH